MLKMLLKDDSVLWTRERTNSARQRMKSTNLAASLQDQLLVYNLSGTTAVGLMMGAGDIIIVHFCFQLTVNIFFF